MRCILDITLSGGPFLSRVDHENVSAIAGVSFGTRDLGPDLFCARQVLKLDRLDLRNASSVVAELCVLHVHPSIRLQHVRPLRAAERG